MKTRIEHRSALVAWLEQAAWCVKIAVATVWVIGELVWDKLTTRKEK